MAADPKDVQELTRYKGVKLPKDLDTPRRVRLATVKVLRAMANHDIREQTGRSLVWGLTQLHGMINDERAAERPPANAGATFNTLVVAGPDSPVARAARQLLGTGATTVDARCLPHEPVPAADGGTE